MSLPAKFWYDWKDLPRLYTWNEAARDELLALIDYDNNAMYRAMLELKEINFETFNLPAQCGSGSSNLTEYCKLAKKLPDLKVTMDMMNLATNPVNFNSNLKQNLK